MGIWFRGSISQRNPWTLLINDQWHKTTNKVTAVNKPWTHVLSVVLIHAELGGADPGRLLDQVLPLDDLPSLGDTGGDLEAHGHHRQK